MVALRLLRVGLHLLVGLWTCAFIFPWVVAEGREKRIQRWSLQLITICGVSVETQFDDGVKNVQNPAAKALIVANHVSWLDIFVINSIRPCRFVAKSDIRDWPVLGWLCEKAGTIFIARGSIRDVRRIFAGMVKSIHDGEHVAFFPEGTTAKQGTVLPFHANLFEAAIDADVPVQPYALRYIDAQGKLHEAADFVGNMTFVESIIAISRARSMTAQLLMLPTIETAGESRRDLAVTARQSIVIALSAALSQS